MGAKSDCTVIGIDDGLAICHTDPQVIKCVLMQCFAIGDQQHEVKVQIGPDESGIAVSPFLGSDI